jgi:hypothetical protein
LSLIGFARFKKKQKNDEGGKAVYFINEAHKDNFLDLLNKFPVAQKDKQYRQACYIVAVPEIYRKAKDFINESPVDWSFDYLDDKLNIDFSNAYQELIKCAVHLWNGHPGFSLYDGLATWDSENFQVFWTAIEIVKSNT